MPVARPGIDIRSSEKWRAPRRFLFGALVLAGLLRLGIAFTDDGIYWPDEIYQSIEPAHRAVFGYGLIAWEFIEGARNWALPGILAGVLALPDALGLHQSAYYLGLTRLLFTAVSLGTAWGIWALARALGARNGPAALAAAAYALCRVSLYFSHRAMSENACALPVVLGLWLLVENASRRRRLIGSSLLGAAVLIRLQCGLFCLATLLWQLARRRFRHAGETLAAFAVAAFFFGWLDHLAWAHAPGARYGGWFHSAFKYIDFNLVRGGGAGWGVSAPDYYFETLKTALPLLWSVVATAALLGSRKAPFVFLTGWAFLIAHSFIPHKELRFVLPMLPLVFAVAAVGVTVLPRGVLRGAGMAALAVSGLVSLAGFRALTFVDIGAYAGRPETSAWDDYGSINRLLRAAGDQGDLCGLRVDNHLAWTGGFSYLHRNVPLYMSSYPSGYYNYAIVAAGSVPGEVAKDGTFELVRTADHCDKDPGYSWHLP